MFLCLLFLSALILSLERDITIFDIFDICGKACKGVKGLKMH